MATIPKIKTDRKGPVISMFGGGDFYLLDPRAEDVHIEDIAHSLSQLCRYNGHTKKFYSVAEHSVHVSRLVDPDVALEGLMHDAAEAYVGDMVAPLKNIMPEFNKIEDRIRRVIWEKFNIPERALPLDVRVIDTNIRYDEARFLIDNPNYLLAGTPEMRVGAKISAWKPHTAKARFLERFNELTEAK